MSTPSRLGQLAGLLLLGTLLALFPVIRLTLFAYSPLDIGDSTSKIVEIHKAESPQEITKTLAELEVIESGKSFLWLGKLTRKWKKIKAGEYNVTRAMTPLEIFNVITSGISIAHPVTIREGENLFEIAEDLAQKKLADRDRFVNLCSNPEFIQSLHLFKEGESPLNLEGYLFPETYFLNRTLNENDIIKQMVRHFVERWDKTKEERAKQLGMNRHQVVTLASIIEKETGASEERAIVSSVFHNRLRIHMKLQSDPTTIYGMWAHFKGKIHRQDLSEENPYNTYTVKALPIGPISNPGEEAIKAALFPAQSPYLYFVSHNDGTHQFSSNLEEHNQAVRKFQLDKKAREGKSWRDHLKKKTAANLNP